MSVLGSIAKHINILKKIKSLGRKQADILQEGRVSYAFEVL